MSTSLAPIVGQKRRRKLVKSDDNDVTANTTGAKQRRKLSKTEEVGGDDDKESSRSNHDSSLDDDGLKVGGTTSGWTSEQRTQLLDAIIKRLPPLDWKQIAGEVEGKSSTMCYDQWRKKMLNDIKKCVSVLPE
ncbi:14782_t:CDS:2 [Acaulospora colombiana]|uniref:14782_t:CDS:1 n=1 Tax=Acaulospora colombiana TaxID=27376 RepID=A0ACA9MXY2_9GLOM|nr:14782_t:CDS:2 [Acaulospora colombiana]